MKHRNDLAGHHIELVAMPGASDDVPVQSASGELSHLHTYEDPIVGDFADAALDADYGLVNSHLAHAESRELARIEHALERMREGGYGICEDCGHPIALTRLQALPYATLCIRCQSNAERGLLAAPTYAELHG